MRVPSKVWQPWEIVGIYGQGEGPIEPVSSNEVRFALVGNSFEPDAALEDHCFQVSKAEAVGQIPANAQQNNRAVEMATSGHGIPLTAAMFVSSNVMISGTVFGETYSDAGMMTCNSGNSELLSAIMAAIVMVALALNSDACAVL